MTAKEYDELEAYRLLVAAEDSIRTATNAINDLHIYNSQFESKSVPLIRLISWLL